MRFTFVDRVLELVPGVRITTAKCLSLGEEYLADHFPRFPVMPGVLMLQAMTEASSWLVRVSEDFTHSITTLKEARNVRFADFVQPGDVLIVTAEIIRSEPREIQLKAQGMLADRPAVSARLTLQQYNLAESRPELADTDAYLRRYWREQLALIYHPPYDPAAKNGVASPLMKPLDAARGND